jgi:hypothetical protein
MPKLKEEAIAAGVPKGNCRLTRPDSDILATALVYKAARLTTYDPFLLFLGREFIAKDSALVIELPDDSLLPFPQEL